MCVASGVLITRTISSSTHAGSTSNSRRPATEQHRDLVNLQVVQHARLERALRRVRAVHQQQPQDPPATTTIAVTPSDKNVRPKCEHGDL